ncbi:MAG: BTAD domain-containing putative transcriptional regulator [Pseudomonadota bacterium]
MSKASDSSGHQILHLNLLGGFSATISGRAVSISSQKAQALLGLLALSPRKSCSREYLRGMLWSESTEERAQTSLRHTIWVLRTIFNDIGFKGLVSGRTEVHLDGSLVSTDVDEMVASLQDSTIDPRLRKEASAFSTLLYGAEDLDPNFYAWLATTREHLLQDLVRQLEDRLGEPDIEPTQLCEIAKILLDLRPLHEQACQALIRGYASIGDAARALEVYQAFWNLLENTYGEEPSAATKDLIVAVKTGAFDPQAAQLPKRQESALDLVAQSGIYARAEANAQDAALRPRLFVADGDASGLAPTRVHILSGFRHDLIACLIRFREWRIIDVQGLSADQLRGLMTASSYGLSISGFDSEKSIRIAITLKDLASNFYVWSERFERQIDSWRQTQNEIVGRLGVALNLHLSADRLARTAVGDDATLEVYDQWLRGQELLLIKDASVWRRADALFRSIIDRYPTFARGYYSRAEIENTRHLFFPGTISNETSRRNALQLAKRAVQLDPLDSRSQLCLGWSSAMCRQFEQAELAFELAHQNNENDPWVLVSAAVGLAFCDRVEASRELSKVALEFEFRPSKTHWSYQAVLYFLNGDYDECITACEYAEEVVPDIPAWHAAALALSGQPAEAREVLARFVENVRANWVAEETPDDQAIADWLTSCYPIRNQETFRQLFRGLREAGLAMPNAAPPSPLE